ncbi:MAG: hypothetical protein HRT72_13805 [Flavobacteriales bacterium]|nr:hypothetical protein [Flavobacteriales bacterium]
MAIHKLAKGKKVVFVNSYQKASKYNFYTGIESFSDNNVSYRKNQYDILDREDTFHNETVLFMSNWSSSHFDTLRLESGELLRYTTVEKYQVFNKLKATIKETDISTLNIGESSLGKIEILNPYAYPIDLNRIGMPYHISLSLEQKDVKEKTIVRVNLDKKIVLEPNSTNQLNISWETPTINPGTYKLQIVIQSGYLFPKVISKKYDVVIS